MKYLSKEELEDITNELLENPTRETLKVLNNKYNSEENGVETKSIVEPVKIDVPEVPIAPEVKLDIPTFEVPNTTNTPESNTPNMNIPTFNIPGSASVNEVQNNKPLGETIPISSEPTVPVNNNINDNKNSTIRFVHEETVPVNEYPEIQVIRTTGEQDVTILSLNLNGDEIFWHQKGDTLIFDQPITAKENTVKVIAVIDGRRIVHMPIWEF